MNTETISNNILIAFFMNGKVKSQLDGKLRESVGDNEIWLPIHGICNMTSIDTGRGKILEYHKNWNWVMLVVERINKLENPKCNSDTTLSTLRTELRYYVGSANISESLYQIINIIKWYNLNNK